jgi:hypothetical protein
VGRGNEWLLERQRHIFILHRGNKCLIGKITYKTSRKSYQYQNPSRVVNKYNDTRQQKPRAHDLFGKHMKEVINILYKLCYFSVSCFASLMYVHIGTLCDMRAAFHFFRPNFVSHITHHTILIAQGLLFGEEERIS